MFVKNGLLLKVFQSFQQLFTGQLLYTIAGFISAYFFANILGPAKYGIWQTANIFTSYVILLSLGLPFVMRRDFIQLRAENKIDEANRIAQQVFSYNLVVNPVFSLILFVIALFFTEDKNFSLALLAVAIINIIQIFSSYGDIMTKAFNQYNKLRNAKIVFSIFSLISIIFVWKYSFNGLLFGMILAQLAYSIYFIFTSPIKYKWYWDNKLLKGLIFIGFPIYLQTIVSVIFTSIDRLIIAANLSFEEVGYYSLSSLISTPVTLLVSTLGIVVFTELNEKYGKDKSAKVIKLHMDLPQKFVILILTPLIILGVMLLPYLTKLFLPDYLLGVTSAQISVFAILLLTLAGFSSNALFILNKQVYAAISFTISGVIKIIGSLLLVKMGYGINGVAIITLIAYLIYDTVMVFWVNKQIKEEINLKIILNRNMPILYSVLVLFSSILLSEIIFRDELSFQKMIFQLIFAICLFIPYLIFAIKKLKNILQIK